MTYMVCNVDDGVCRPVGIPTTGFGRHHIGIISPVNLNIDFESLAEGGDFHVVPVGTSTSHLSQMALKSSVNFLCGRWNIGIPCGESACILPLWISSRSPSRVNFNELLIVVTLQSHVIDRARTQFAILGLIPEELVRERIEETVACSANT